MPCSISAAGGGQNAGQNSEATREGRGRGSHRDNVADVGGATRHIQEFNVPVRIFGLLAPADPAPHMGAAKSEEWRATVDPQHCMRWQGTPTGDWGEGYKSHVVEPRLTRQTRGGTWPSESLYTNSARTSLLSSTSLSTSLSTINCVASSISKRNSRFAVLSPDTAGLLQRTPPHTTLPSTTAVG